MKRLRLAVAVVWIGVLSVPAFAFAGWSQPVRLSVRSPYGDLADSATVGIDRSGDGLAVWEQQNGGTNKTSPPYRVMTASRLTGSGAWSGLMRLSPLDVSTDDPVAAVSPSGAAVAAWVANPLPHTNYRHPAFIQASTRSADGGWSPPVRVSPGGAAGLRQIGVQLAVAVDGRGDAVAAWIALPARGKLIRVEVATFDASTGRWSRATVLATSTDPLAFAAVQVAEDPHGDVIVVWRKDSTTSYASEVQAAVKTHGSHPWQRFPGLGEENQLPGEQFLAFELVGPQVAIDSRGDALVVWQSGQGRQLTTHASAWLASDHRWHRQRPVSRAFAVWPHVAAGPNGVFAVIWITHGGQVAEASKGVSACCWTKPTTLSQGPGLASYPKIALGPNGEAVAAWSGSDSIEVAARANATQPWTLPKALGGQNAGLSGIAINSQGSAAIVWVQPGKAHDQRPDNYIDAATYSQAGGHRSSS